MNSRQGALLRALLEASGYRTSADYSSPIRLLGSHGSHRRQGPQLVFRARGTRHAGGPPARGRAAPCAGSRRGEPARALARGE